jgi:hypothetical protein
MRGSPYVVDSSATASTPVGSASVVSLDSSDGGRDEDEIPTFKEIICSSKSFPKFESAGFLRRVFVCLIVLTAALVGLSVFGGIWSRKTVLDASDNSVNVEFASLSFSVSQVVQETLLTAVNVLGVLGASMSVRRSPDYDEFLHMSATIRNSIRNPIVQWAPRILHADRTAWEGTVTSSLGLPAQIMQVWFWLVFVCYPAALAGFPETFWDFPYRSVWFTAVCVSRLGVPRSAALSLQKIMIFRFPAFRARLPHPATTFSPKSMLRACVSCAVTEFAGLGARSPAR